MVLNYSKGRSTLDGTATGASAERISVDPSIHSIF